MDSVSAVFEDPSVVAFVVSTDGGVLHMIYSAEAMNAFVQERELLVSLTELGVYRAYVDPGRGILRMPLNKWCHDHMHKQVRGSVLFRREKIIPKPKPVKHKLPTFVFDQTDTTSQPIKIESSVDTDALPAVFGDDYDRFVGYD